MSSPGPRLVSAKDFCIIHDIVPCPDSGYSQYDLMNHHRDRGLCEQIKHNQGALARGLGYLLTKPETKVMVPILTQFSQPPCWLPEGMVWVSFVLEYTIKISDTVERCANGDGHFDAIN